MKIHQAYELAIAITIGGGIAVVYVIAAAGSAS